MRKIIVAEAVFSLGPVVSMLITKKMIHRISVLDLMCHSILVALVWHYSEMNGLSIQCSRKDSHQ